MGIFYKNQKWIRSVGQRFIDDERRAEGFTVVSDSDRFDNASDYVRQNMVPCEDLKQVGGKYESQPVIHTFVGMEGPVIEIYQGDHGCMDVRLYCSKKGERAFLIECLYQNMEQLRIFSRASELNLEDRAEE